MRQATPFVFALMLVAPTVQAQTPRTLHIEPVSNGYVTGPGINCGAGRTDCEEVYFVPDPVALQAVPSPGYQFLGWRGNVCVGGEQATVINMSVDRSCTALFAAIPGSGEPEVPDYSTALFIDSELVGIGPPLPAGSKNRQVYLPDDTPITAEFVSPDALFFKVSTPYGSWFVSFGADPGSELAVGSYDFISQEWVGGGVVGLSASWAVLACGSLDLPSRGFRAVVPSRFIIYEIELAAGTVQRFAADFEMFCSPTVTVAGSIRYHSTRSTMVPFEGKYPVYRLLVDPTIGGTVTAPSIDCGEGRPGLCQVDYLSPTVVTLRAEPSPGYQFMAWGGACKGSAPTAEVTVSREQKCLAAFYPIADEPRDPALTRAIWLVDFHRNGAQPLREFKWPEVANVSTTRLVGWPGPAATVSSGWALWGGAWVAPQDRQRWFFLTFGDGHVLPGDYPAIYTGTSGMSPTFEMFDQLSTRDPPLRSTAFICVPSVARVRIYEAEVDATGKLVSFAADFEALCRPGSYTYMVGAVRFNSSRASLQPFDGDYPLHRLDVDRPVSGGRIVASGIDCGAGPHTHCTESFSGLTDLTMQAIPGPGYEFVAWTGACKGAATTTVRVDWSRTCSAVFNPVIPGFGVDDPRAQNAFLVEGAPGNSFTTGRHLYTNAAVYRVVGVHPTWAILNVFLPDGRWWTVRVRVPHDQVLRPGVYEATLFGSIPSAEPQLSVLLGSTGCFPNLTGRFMIHEISFSTVEGSLTLNSLAVDFEQRCNGTAPPLVGSLRYNSSYRTLTPFQATVAPPPPPPTADFDADGSPDLLWRHRTTGRNALWLMNGTSVKSTVALTPAAAATVSDTDWEIRAVADFNGDTHPDVVWQHKTNGRLAVWFMSGSSLIAGSGLATLSGTSVETDLDWKIVGAGDVNRDTQTDLLWRHQLSGAVRVWHLSGLEQWDSIDVLPAVSDVQWEINGLGDVNGDGWLDIVWRHYGHGALAAWFMRDTSLVQAQRLSPSTSADLSWHIVGLADANRDGQLDLVWQHYVDGRLGIWYMNGVELMSATTIDRNVSSNVDWRIVGVK